MYETKTRGEMLLLRDVAPGLLFRGEKRICAHTYISICNCLNLVKGAIEPP